jgi:hypothetical protein
MRCHWFGLAVIVVCLVPRAILAQADGKKPMLDRIFDDWKHRQDLLKTVRYVITGTTEFKDQELPSGNPVRPRRTVLLLDLERKRWRLESSESAISVNGGKGLTYVPRVGTLTFDRTALQAYYHRDLNGIQQEDGPDLTIDKGEQLHPGFDTHVWPLFFGHGIVATVQRELRGDDLPTTYDSEDFEMRGQLPFRGRTCTVVRTMAMPGMGHIFDEFWIDLNQKSAIYRHVYFTGSNPWMRTDIDWKQTDFGWWPDQWTQTWTDNGRVKRIHRLRIESFEPNLAVSDADFKLEAKPGMKVVVAESSPPPGKGLNLEFPATTTYVISPSGSWQEVSGRGYTTLDGRVLPPERSRAWIWWAVTLASATLTYILWRRWFKAAIAPGK